MIEQSVVSDETLELPRNDFVPDLLGLAFGFQFFLDCFFSRSQNFGSQLATASELRNVLHRLAEVFLLVQLILSVDLSLKCFGFLLHELFVEFVGVKDRRFHSSDVHRHAAEELIRVVFCSIFVRNQNADLRTRVDVRSQVFAFNDFQVRHFDLFADLAGFVDQTFLDSRPVNFECVDVVDGFAVSIESHLGDGIRQLDERFVLSNEIGFATKRQKQTFVAFDHSSHDAFGSFAVRTFRGDLLAFLAEVVHCAVQVATGFFQCLLAVHHPSAGGLAKFAHRLSGNRRHVSVS